MIPIPPALAARGLFGLAKGIWLLIALIGAVLLGWWLVDSIGDAREREIAAERVEDALEGERRANEADERRRAEREAESERTRQDLEKIHGEDPDAAKAPASPGSRRVADRLRS